MAEVERSTPNPPLMRLSNPKLLAALAAACILIAGILISVATRPHTLRTVTTAQVSITGDGFIPATLSVKPGTKVIFTNTDTKPHQIQANPHPTGRSLPGLSSQILNTTQSYSYTFAKTGTYAYHDYLVPTTNGTIQVK